VNRTVEKNKTLLVDGPASVMLVSGKAEAFGATMTTAGRVVIREGKRLPFAVRETATFDISLGMNAAAEEVDGDTVPQSWMASWE
jgi:3-polyprenyl-4-hydroxybenzoate decarboxylase